MEYFDEIVVGLGIVLIAAGVIMFITGKVVSQNNQIEGFGVKLNLNNPSILLVVAGMVLVLVPRLLPAPKDAVDKIPNLPATSAGPEDDRTRNPNDADKLPAAETEPSAFPPTTLASIVGSDVAGAPASSHADTSANAASIPATRPAAAASQATRPPSLAGSFDLDRYLIDNIPQNLEGSMEVYPTGENQYEWMVELDSFNVYGMPEVYFYNGLLYLQGSQWLLQITYSNDISWVNTGPVPTKVRRGEDTLSFEYPYMGSRIQLMWSE